MSVLAQAAIFMLILGVLMLFIFLDLPTTDVLDEVIDEVFGDD